MWFLLTMPALALDGGRFGDVQVVVPGGEIRGYVVLFSGVAGWTQADKVGLDALGAQGALAVGVDTRTYLNNLTKGDQACDNLVGDVEGLSRQLQRQHSGLQYHFPIVAGVGTGGTLAGLILAQSPVNTLAGAISVDPSLTLPGKRPLCGAGAASKHDAGYVYGPTKTLNGFWSVGLTASEAADARTHIKDLENEGTPMAFTLLAGTPADGLASLLQPHLAKAEATGISDLPLIELPSAKPSDLLAVVLSGDGGWRDLDKTIAEELQSRGVSVVGWDSVRYFWSKKSPEQTAADLSAVIQTYTEKWHADKVALVGYSFGADVLPFAYNLLDADIKSHVAEISLLGFADAADWQIRVAGWLGAAPSAEALPVAPAIKQVPSNLVQCFYGQEETDSLCPELAGRGAEIIQTTGGHHFDGNYARLALRILEGLNRRKEQ
ncbi:AcvB/VirJ family lysyl-phosphatidylglycerol hydrolase [Mesorhizobium sp. WSM4976]|uniref:virulence factor family protein n=1 Tax=Mesorhizobium sp. WSM4976 TaxID=3038549 RepID=UPI002417326F|nr:AcvB/VirJ family lysyl-phosphatidylglycerol hydrolase [Mesorhizobium sp. WSM4976]MDG4897703.1 AcvB/VirJ family lysyl-phosphatidylglycerol hydrolase [Mesorhizobium sp. WSM4976]